MVHPQNPQKKLVVNSLGNFSEASALVALSRWTGTSNVQIVTVRKGFVQHQKLGFPKSWGYPKNAG